MYLSRFTVIYLNPLGVRGEFKWPRHHTFFDVVLEIHEVEYVRLRISGGEAVMYLCVVGRQGTWHLDAVSKKFFGR